MKSALCLPVAVLLAVSAAPAATITQQFTTDFNFADAPGLGSGLIENIAPFDTSLGQFQLARVEILMDGDVRVEVSCAGLPLALCEQDTVTWGAGAKSFLDSVNGPAATAEHSLLFDETVTFREVFPDFDNPDVADFQSRMVADNHRVTMLEWQSAAPFFAFPYPLFFVTEGRPTFHISPDGHSRPGNASYNGSLFLTVNYDYIPADAVPEPSTMGLAGTALIALAAISRYRTRHEH